jgi:hypothetical protein
LNILLLLAAVAVAQVLAGTVRAVAVVLVGSVPLQVFLLLLGLLMRLLLAGAVLVR